jgi:hypothetical protein
MPLKRRNAFPRVRVCVSPSHSSVDTPQRPDADCAGILRARAAGTAAPALGFRCVTDVRCVGDGCGLRAHAASADSSPERDHSAGSLSSAGCGRDTGGLPRSDLRRLLPPLTAVACTPLPRLRADRSRSFEEGKVSRPPAGKRIAATASAISFLACGRWRQRTRGTMEAGERRKLIANSAISAIIP